VISRGREARVAEDHRRPAVTLTVVEHEIAPDHSVSVTTIDVGVVASPRCHVDQTSVGEERD
jgi:hypothetical protein